MLTIWPSIVCTKVAHPTEQYGQTLGVVLASLMRSSCARASVGARFAPSPAKPPSAVPPATPPETFRKSRRETSIRFSALFRGAIVERAIDVPTRSDHDARGTPIAAAVRRRRGGP